MDNSKDAKGFTRPKMSPVVHKDDEYKEESQFAYSRPFPSVRHVPVDASRSTQIDQRASGFGKPTQIKLDVSPKENSPDPMPKEQ